MSAESAPPQGRTGRDEVLLHLLVQLGVDGDDARAQLRHRRHVSRHDAKVACGRRQQHKVHLHAVAVASASEFVEQGVQQVQRSLSGGSLTSAALKT